MVYFYRFVKDLKAFLLKKQTGRIFKRCFFVLLYALAARNSNGLSLRAFGPSIYTELIIQRRPVPSLNNWIFSNQQLVQGLMRSLLKESNQTEQQSTNYCKKAVDQKLFFIIYLLYCCKLSHVPFRSTTRHFQNAYEGDFRCVCTMTF